MPSPITSSGYGIVCCSSRPQTLSVAPRRDAKRKVDNVQNSTGLKPFLHPLKLLIVDEADRLKTTSLEQLRYLFDRGEFGLVIIGMPGIEKRLARYPQLYSRIGFVHHYRPLPTTELRQILLRHLPELVELPPVQGLDAPDVVAAILRITGGNLAPGRQAAHADRSRARDQ